MGETGSMLVASTGHALFDLENAKLIAKAPDLLECTKMASTLVISILPQIGSLAIDIGLLNDFLIDSQRIIKKLEGEDNEQAAKN